KIRRIWVNLRLCTRDPPRPEAASGRRYAVGLLNQPARINDEIRASVVKIRIRLGGTYVLQPMRRTATTGLSCLSEMRKCHPGNRGCPSAGTSRAPPADPGDPLDHRWLSLANTGSGHAGPGQRSPSVHSHGGKHGTHARSLRITCNGRYFLAGSGGRLLCCLGSVPTASLGPYRDPGFGIPGAFPSTVRDCPRHLHPLGTPAGILSTRVRQHGPTALNPKLMGYFSY